jgi:hypothetical protein
MEGPVGLRLNADGERASPMLTIEWNDVQCPRWTTTATQSRAQRAVLLSMMFCDYRAEMPNLLATSLLWSSNSPKVGQHLRSNQRPRGHAPVTGSP